MATTMDGNAVTWGACEHQLTLWGIGTGRCMRAHWMLAELELGYVSRRIQSRTGETMAAEYLQLNPRHKIPLLQHESLIVSESAAIVQYLSERFAVPSTFCVPQDPAGRAQLNEWCYFVMAELDGHTLYVMRRHGDLKHLYGEAPGAVAAAKDYFCEHIEAVTPWLDRHGEYLLGPVLSVADILLTTCLDWAVAYAIPLPTPMLAYRERVTSRPGYRVARQRNDARIPPAEVA